MSRIEIHERAMRNAKNLKSNLVQVFEDIIEIETKQIYLDLEITSLRTYCVEMLDLSPATAKDLITVALKSMEVPSLAECIRSGKASVYKARKICSVLTVMNAHEWIPLACECSCRVVEKAVAMANPREAVYESTKFVGENVLEHTMAVSEEWESYLKQTKDLMSQRYGRAVSSEEATFILMKAYCEKENPVRKAERFLARKKSSARAGSRAHSNSSKRNRYRPSLVEHEVHLRDQGQCTHVERNGNRCEQRRWLHLHHLVHYANGGEHSSENLVTLCSAHHRMKHREQVVT